MASPGTKEMTAPVGFMRSPPIGTVRQGIGYRDWKLVRSRWGPHDMSRAQRFGEHPSG